MNRDPKLTHRTYKKFLDQSIQAHSIEDAKAQFNAILDGIKFDHEIESVDLKLRGFVRTGAHPIIPSFE
ncbi:MAG: hypothetical protein ACOYN4_00810 [Bacteroidales bacterium]